MRAAPVATSSGLGFGMIAAGDAAERAGVGFHARVSALITVRQPFEGGQRFQFLDLAAGVVAGFFFRIAYT